MSKVRSSRFDKFKQFDKSFASFNDRDMRIYVELYDKNLDDHFEPASGTFVAAGSMMLFCNWLMFNGGSSFSITKNSTTSGPEKVIITTIISGSTACLSTIILRPLMMTVNKQDETNRFDLSAAAGALLSGCVSITASCAYVSLMSSAAIGLFGCFLFIAARIVFERLHIDDPLEASQIHGVCGFWGVIAVGLFHEERGLFTTGQMNLIGVQLIGAFAMITFAYSISYVFFTILVSMNRFRVGDIIELAGMDVLDNAYNKDFCVYDFSVSSSDGYIITKEMVAALEEKQRRARLKYNLRVK